MLRHRLFFGSLLIALVLGLLFADSRLSQTHFAQHPPSAFLFFGMARCDGLIVAAILVGLVILGTRELLQLLRAADCAPLRRWPILVNVVLLLIPLVAANGPLADHSAIRAADAFATINFFVFAMLSTGLFIAARRKTDGAISAMGSSLLAIVYLGLLPQFLLRLRVFDPAGSTWLLLYFVFTVKFCDIGAYFTGLAFGRHKLIEWLSPKKTIEGLIGGVAASVIFAVGVPLLVRSMADPSAQVYDLFPPLLRCASFGALMALIGQAGDLFESMIKRGAQAKDSANAIPAFGGILDLIDSLLPTAPMACWILLK